MAKREYEKAAFIYLKLLKDYHAAASCLKQGKMYEKAAHVDLKFLKNDVASAECFEDGRIYDRAIELYEKSEKFEKAGYLYLELGDRVSADRSFNIVIANYLSKSKYIKASLVSKIKLRDLHKAN